MEVYDQSWYYRSLSRLQPAMSGTTHIATPPTPPTTSFGYYRSHPREPENLVSQPKYFYILESESSQDSDNNASESSLSIQGKETDLVKDTSDSEWSTDGGSVIEYDVVSSSEEKNKAVPMQIIDGDGSSDTDDNIIAATVISFTVLDEGELLSADSEESLSSSDIELAPRKCGYSLCAECKTLHNTPFRYCGECYKERKDFFPPRPKRKRPKAERLKKHHDSFKPSQDKVKAIDIDFKNIPVSLKSETIVSNSIRLDINNIKNSPSKSPINTDDKTSNETSGKGDGISNRKRTLEEDVDEISAKRMKDDECLHMEPQEPLSFSQPSMSMFPAIPSKSMSEPGIALSKNEIEMIRESHGNYSDNEANIALKKAMAGTSDTQVVSAKNASNSDSDLCMICMVERKSGIFAHGRIGHICCCYKCSLKVWSKTKRCPICKCKVSNVLKAFVV